MFYCSLDIEIPCFTMGENLIISPMLSNPGMSRERNMIISKICDDIFSNIPSEIQHRL